jgi:prepilin-type processing-associated H-X9-DG protein
MSQSPYPPPPYSTPPARRGMPWWGILLIVLGGCGMLAVAAVIVLGAITVPMFAQAREAARRAHCASNTKSAAMALMLYAQDYDERLPPAEQWQTRVRPNLPPGADPFRCPTTTTGASLAYNSRLSRKRVAEIVSTSRQPGVFDSSATTPEPADPLTSFEARHRSKDGPVGNVGFLDGSVKSLPAAPPADAGLVAEP